MSVRKFFLLGGSVAGRIGFSSSSSSSPPVFRSLCSSTREERSPVDFASIALEAALRGVLLVEVAGETLCVLWEDRASELARLVTSGSAGVEWRPPPTSAASWPLSSGSVSRRRSSPSSGFGSGTGAGGELGGKDGEAGASFGELVFGDGVGGPEVPIAIRSGRRRRLELRLIGIFEDL